MKKITTILLAAITIMSCGNNHNNSTGQPAGAITVNIYYTGSDGSARKFVEEMEFSGTADAVRNEEGNLRYDYFFSASDPETVLLIDSWSSQEAINAHHATSMMQTISDLREKFDLHMTVERYTKDEQGMPASDQSFVRE